MRKKDMYCTAEPTLPDETTNDSLVLNFHLMFRIEYGLPIESSLLLLSTFGYLLRVAKNIKSIVTGGPNYFGYPLSKVYTLDALQLQVEKEWKPNPPCGVYRTLYATGRIGFPFVLYRDAKKSAGAHFGGFNSDLARADWRNQSVEIDLLLQLFCARGRLHRQGWNEKRKQKLVLLCQKQRQAVDDTIHFWYCTKRHCTLTESERVQAT